MPPGLLGMVSKVQLCPQAQAQAGACGAQSEIGSATVGAGPGPEPVFVNGSVYLTGPYEGAPFGLSIVVPATVGPFDLGTIVVGAKIDVNPTTAALTITSGPLPQSLDGIPLQLETVNLDIDREGFMLNPTDCRPLAFEGTVQSSQSLHGARLLALSGGQLRGAGVQAKAQRADARQDEQSARRLPAREDRLLAGSGEHREARGRPSQAADAAPVDAAARLPGDGDRSQPGRLPRSVGRGQRHDHHSHAAPAARGAGLPCLPRPRRHARSGVRRAGRRRDRRRGRADEHPARDPRERLLLAARRSVLDARAGPHRRTALAVRGEPAGEGRRSMCGQSLEMPTEITGQNGAVLKQTTKLGVAGCAKPKARRKAKRRA